MFTNPFYEMEEEEKREAEVERKRKTREELGASASGDPDAKVWEEMCELRVWCLYSVTMW